MKALYEDGEFVRQLTRALEPGVGEPPMELLLELQELIALISGNTLFPQRIYLIHRYPPESRLPCNYSSSWRNVSFGGITGLAC